MAQIASYYAGLVGVTGEVGVSNFGGNQTGKSITFYVHTGDKQGGIYLDARSTPAGLSPLLDDFNNLNSAIEHEDAHKQSGLGGKNDPLGHVEVYITQIKGKYFDNTTPDFQEAVAGNLAFYLTEEAKAVGTLGGSDFTQLNAIIDDLNKLSNKTGYTYDLVHTGSGNPDYYTYSVVKSKVTKPEPIKKAKK